LRRLRRENAILREEKEILRKAGFLRSGDRSAPMRFRLIDEERAHHRISSLCRT
jgi:transposase-like protein